MRSLLMSLGLSLEYTNFASIHCWNMIAGPERGLRLRRCANPSPKRLEEDLKYYPRVQSSHSLVADGCWRASLLCAWSVRRPKEKGDVFNIHLKQGQLQVIASKVELVIGCNRLYVLYCTLMMEVRPRCICKQGSGGVVQKWGERDRSTKDVHGCLQRLPCLVAPVPPSWTEKVRPAVPSSRIISNQR